ncbi:MAG TPA: undecaprenyl-diphosphate phosphatase [Opitutaceae bacterium]
MRCFILILLLTLAGSGRAAAATPESAVQSELTARDAIILGLVEGVTEFLPISSTGHLIIASRTLGLDAEAPLRDEAGNPLWHEAPSEDNPAGVPLTRKLAVDTYIVVIQVGAIAAVVLLYWGQLIGILRGLTGQNAIGVRLLRNLILAFLPVVFVGLLLDDWIDANLFSIGAVVAALVSGAVLMFAAERWRQQHTGAGTPRKEPHELSVRESIGIGCMQCLALWPGMSRSMVTMVGGYFAGLSPAKSAEFSFLVGLPVLGGAAAYKLMKAGPGLLQVFGWGEMLLGAAVAAISAAIAIKFLVGYLGRNGLGVFAVYRLVLAVVLAAVFLI